MEGLKILSIIDLVKKADEKWRSMAEQRKQEENANKATLEAALKLESELQGKLKEARAVVANMEAEYIVIETKASRDAVRKVKSDSLTEDDVKSGKITLNEFHAKGKSAAARTKLATEMTLKEMSASLEAIRSKRREILRFELELCKQQRKVFSISLYPGYSLIKALKDHADFVDRETAVLLHERVTSDSNVTLKESEVLLCEGKSLGAGHMWNDLAIDDAHRVAFNPMLPKSLVVELKEKLLRFTADDRVNVRLNMGLGAGAEPSLDVDITQTGKIIKTSGKIFEKKGGKIVEREPVEKTTLTKY